MTIGTTVSRRTSRSAVGLLLAAALAGCAGSHGSGGASSATSAPTSTGAPSAADTATAGRTTTPPWPAPNDAVTYIAAAGLPPMSEERVDVHYHAHLDIFDNGRAVAVAPYIGIDPNRGRISPLHTHDASGIVHIESPKQDRFTLGQLFTEWNVRLTQDCIGGLCATADKPLKVYVDGKQTTGDPREIVFAEHQEIAIVYGDPPAKIPSSYGF